jgi:hypothetical protein
MKKKTIGQISQDLLQSGSGSVNPLEIAYAREKEYLDNLVWCVNHALKKVDCSSIKGHDECVNRSALTGDFFIEVLLKKEEKLQNVLRTYFIPRSTCPTPFFDHTVFRYNSKKEEIEYLWTIPDQEMCLTLKENKQKVVPSEQQSLEMVLMYYDGKLHRLAKKFNGETMNAGVALEGV